MAYRRRPRQGLRRHGISLRRRRSWCLSTDPAYAQKAADVVGLYLDPPENALVLCVDEKPGIPALERSQGWLRLPDGRALTGFAHEYKRHWTTTLFAALEVASGLIQTGHHARRRRREFFEFMNEVLAAHPDPELELHVVLDNLSTHKPRHDRWLAQQGDPVSVYPFIAAEKVAARNVSKACALLEISRSAYSVWQQHLPSARALSDERLGEAIVTIHGASRQTYGAPRITAALRRQGIRVGQKRVARLVVPEWKSERTDASSPK